MITSCITSLGDQWIVCFDLCPLFRRGILEIESLALLLKYVAPTARHVVNLFQFHYFEWPMSPTGLYSPSIARPAALKAGDRIEIEYESDEEGVSAINSIAIKSL